MSEQSLVIDPENFMSEKENAKTFKYILMNHLSKITAVCIKEFRGGYWQKRLTTDGKIIIDEYVPDSREEYCNAIDCLNDLLFPHYDTKTSGKIDKIENDFEELQTSKGNIEEFKDKKRVLKRKLFREISLFLYQENYLSSEDLEE